MNELVVRRSSVEIPPIPTGRLMEIHGTNSLSDEDWKRLSRVPGLFFLEEGSGSPVPAGGNVAVIERYLHGGWPEPLFLPYAQLPDLVGSYPVLTMDPSLAPTFDATPHGFTFRNGMALYRFQSDAVSRFIHERRMLLLLPIGAGKTAVAIYAGEELRRRNVIDRIVVVASRMLLGNLWTPSVRMLSGVEPAVVDGPLSKRAKQWASDSPWLLTKYDTWRTDRRFVRPILGPRTMVVIDEVHHLKSPETKRWGAVRELLDSTGTDYRLFLTGTLVYDRPVDAYGPISLLGLRVWNTYGEFKERYFDVRKFPTGRIGFDGRPTYVEVPGRLKGATEAELLKGIIDNVSFHRSREEVDLYLPALVEETRTIVVTPPEKSLYDEVVLSPLTSLVGDDESPRSSATTARVLALLTMERLLSADPWVLCESDSPTALEIKDRIGTEKLLAMSPGSKAKALVEYLGDFLEEDFDTKAVVFASFVGLPRLVLDPLRWEDDEYRPTVESIRAASVFLEGGLDTAARGDVLARFKTDPSVRILFATDVGGEGIDGLQGVARQVIHYDDPWSLGKHEQRIGRVWRRGQTRPVLSLRFESSPEKEMVEMLSKANTGSFVDARVRELLDWKRGQRSMVVET